MSTRPRITVLLIAAPILFLLGALGTAYAWLADGLSQYNDPATTTAQYAVAFLIGASGAIALIVMSRRSEPSRLRRAGTITGAALAGLAVLVSGLPLAVSIGGLVHNAALSAQPLTDAETTSISELQARSGELFEGLGLADGESMNSTYGCSLSNLDRGQQLVSYEVFRPLADEKDAALDAIEQRWASLGYDLHRSEDSLWADPQGSIVAARVTWYSEAGTLAIDVTSICVVKD